MTNRLALAPGTILADEYRIAGALRHDGFCITYGAEDLQMRTRVLVKEYFPAEIADRVRLATVRPKSTRDVGALSWGRQRFIEEAHTLSKFSHSGIARLKRVLEDNNTAYAVLEAEDWPTLLSWIGKIQRPPTQAEVDRIATELLDTLQVLHDANVLVRDLSPESIYVREAGQLVLVDFGGAKFQFAARARKTHTVVRPGYSAPEQYLAEDTQHGPWTDIFSLGGVLYRLVTGRSPVDVIHRHPTDEMPHAVAAAVATYRPEFLAAIDQALKLTPEARPQSVKSWRAMLAHGTGPTLAPGLAPATAPTASSPAPAPGSSARAQPAAAPPHVPQPRIDAAEPAVAAPLPRSAPLAVGRSRVPVVVAGILLVLSAILGLSYAILQQTTSQQRALAKKDLAEFIRAKEQDKVSADRKRPVPAAEPSRQTARDRMSEDIARRREDETRSAAELQHLNEENARKRREAEVLRAAEEQRQAAELSRARAEDARRTGERHRLAEDAEQRRRQDELSVNGARRDAELQRQAEEAAQLSQRQRLDAEQQIAMQIAVETNPDALRRVAAQNPMQRALVERRITDLALIRIATPEGEIWRRPGDGNSFRDCPNCPPLVALPPGRFLMGSPPGEAGRQENEDNTPDRGGEPVHVTIAKAFAIGRFEVTRGEFAAFLAETRHPMDGGCMVRIDAFELLPEHSWRAPGFPQDDQHPAACVNWHDAQAYTAWLSRKTGMTYRLPSEAEWEYAARGAPKPAAQPRFSFGATEQDLCAHANGADLSARKTYPHWQVAPCTDNHVHTAPVGSFKANTVGLHDMQGNLWEWTADCYHDSYRGQPATTQSTGAAWLGECDAAQRVLRGGSWSDPPSSLRPAARIAMPTGRRLQIGGFRVVRELNP